MGKIAKTHKFIIICLTTLIFISAGSASAQDTVIFSTKDIFHPVIANNGMVSSQERYASQAGLAVLKKGGNAVDAAVTIGFTRKPNTESSVTKRAEMKV